MYRVLLLSLVGLVTVINCDGNLPRKIMHTINQWNLREKCFGRKNLVDFTLAMHNAAEHCKQLAPLYDIEAIITKPPRTKPFSQSGSPWQTLPQPINRNPWASLPASQQSSDSQLLSKLAELLVPALRQQMIRNKRQAGGLIETDESDLQEFLEDFADFKEGMATKISNLTCVLTQMNMLDANLQPNMPYFTETGWDGLDTSEPNLAFYDPEWKMKMINGYKDCNDIAESWPQASLDRNELTKVYGRHMIFFTCIKKVQVTNCAKFMIKEWLEAWYGKHDEGDPTQYGFPADKYDAAALSLMVLNDAATPEEEFVNDFFWGKDEM